LRRRNKKKTLALLQSNCKTIYKIFFFAPKPEQKD
jgi:hypothetical protein